jgi:hypothetical protein
MKKSRRIFIALLFMLLLLCAAFIVQRGPGGTSLASLRPYMVKEDTFYIVPANLHKSIPPRPGSEAPLMLHAFRLNHIGFGRLDRLVQHDLELEKDWQYMPYQGLTTYAEIQTIVAYKNPMGFASLSSSVITSPIDVEQMIIIARRSPARFLGISIRQHGILGARNEKAKALGNLLAKSKNARAKSLRNGKRTSGG